MKTAAKVEIVKELPVTQTGAKQCLIKRGRKYFVVSSVFAYSGFETLIFPSTKDGTVTDWSEVGGGRGMSREDAIESFAS